MRSIQPTTAAMPKIPELNITNKILYISHLTLEPTFKQSGPSNGAGLLVYRLLNPLRLFAAGQWAVFQGASEAPLSESYGSSEQRGKTANWPRPGGLR